MPGVLPQSSDILMPFGSQLVPGGVCFQLWAPDLARVTLQPEGMSALPMARRPDGFHAVTVPGLTAGARYRFRLPDDRLIADPASRYQPEGVEGPSQVTDPGAYIWQNPQWQGRPWEEAIFYEIHPGAFTPEGTWAAAQRRLRDLADLGITALQIMPVAQSYGAFNWGYDGVLWYAPSAAYGPPEAFKAFIDAVHGLGLMVCLDVVYNHFGPVGNHLSELGPAFSASHESPWGPGLNLDGPGSEMVREFICQNALYWLREFRLDGLRIDAAHMIFDDSPRHLLAELTERARRAHPGRSLHLIAENSDNEARWLTREASGEPKFFTAQWNDDLHHALHAAATGEVTGYYADFAPDEPGFSRIGRALAEGYTFQGEHKRHEERNCGTPSAHLPPTAFVSYMQNHDQVGNRVTGSRIHHYAPPEAVRAFSTVVLLAPQIPLLFMGEEVAARTPFPFFSDMPPELRQDILEGRKEELLKTPEPEDPRRPDPDATLDPCDPASFQAAKLNHSETPEEPGAEWRAFVRELIALRQQEIVPRLRGIGGHAGSYIKTGPLAVCVTWAMGDGSRLRLRLNLSEQAQWGLPPPESRLLRREGEAGPDRLGPWSLDFSLSGTGT